ncbi:phosphoribosylglycinamide synthetase C domain-containing protein, partial [Mesorhizobium sp. M0643]|uniref:phosphoribosylglycinamide synthetase C domain-containing protein n=1 Tax=Mesorhizobium sp. M0643 TaxID=2956978 RepID=UPI0033375934
EEDGREIRYPGWPHGDFEVSFPISGLDVLDPRNCRLFFANVRRDAQDRLVTSGGRVVHVTGIGDNTTQAVSHAYANIEKVRFVGMSYRSDIGVIYNSNDRGPRRDDLLRWQISQDAHASHLEG